MSFTVTVLGKASVGGGGGGSPSVATAPVTSVAGHTIAVITQNEGGTTMSMSDTFSSAWTAKTALSNGVIRTQYHYTLNQLTGGSTTYTCTFGVNTGGALIVIDIAPSGSNAFDVETGSTGNSTSADSGAFTTTGSDELVLSGCGNENVPVLSSMQINGSAADGSDSTTNLYAWWKAFGTTLTNAHATATVTASDKWLCPVISFKNTASGIAIPVITRQFRTRWG